jgi:hypothetical protein
MMAYNIQNYRVSGVCPSSGILINLKTHRLGNWICFCLQVKVGRYLLCCVPQKELTSLISGPVIAVSSF